MSELDPQSVPLHEMKALQAERDALKQELEDNREAYCKTVIEDCAPDEKHCTCVPHLRKFIGELLEVDKASWAWIVSLKEDDEETTKMLWHRMIALREEVHDGLERTE